jgi:sialidase-1
MDHAMRTFGISFVETMMKTIFAVIAVTASNVFFSGGLANSASAVPKPTAKVTSLRLPLLIRNDTNPVLKIEVDNPTGGDLAVNTFAIDLSGTDERAIVTELQVFETAQRAEFAANRSIGRIEPAADRVLVSTNGSIPPGKSIFWLSCKIAPNAPLTSRIAVNCVAIETSAVSIEPVLEAKPARHRIGIALRKAGDDNVHTSRIPALTTTKASTLLCVYDLRRREGRDLQEDIDIGLSRSIDGGQTWEPVRVIMDMGEYGGMPQEVNGCSDPGIIVDRQTGEIFCFAVWMHGKAGKHQWRDDGSEPGFEIGKAAQFLMVRSTDDGITWSKPENLTRSLKKAEWWLLAPAPQSGFQMTDGTLVMPVQGRTGRDDQATFATIMTSRDHGRTWSVGNPGYAGGNECQAAQLDDGSIMLNVRNDLERYRAVVITSDQGKTWKPHPTSRNTMIEPNCNASLIRVDQTAGGKSKSVLLFSNPHTQKLRTHQTIQVSPDQGMTWPERLHVLLDEGRGAGYSSLARIDDEHVGIVYEGSRAHVTFQKFRIADLLGGADR